MSLNDPIADMLTRVRNASRAGKQEVSMPSSKIKEAIAEVLRDNGYVASFKVEGESTRDLTIELKYEGDAPVIEGLERVSKPSCRVYASSDNIPRVLDGLGIALISTSSGVLADRGARDKNVGGEVLCYVW
ncbi:MAG: 30S ribosomal protein S8 [Lentisphaeria bacterium]